MLVTDRLTIGEITFIFRLIIQALNYTGIFILGLIILINAPRIAPITTHDILNRIIGKITFTYSSIKWCLSSIVGRDPGPKSPIPHAFLLSVIFFTIYSACVVVSDVGLLGFHTCTTLYPPYWDFPSSINSDLAADKAVASTLINGTLPSNVKVFRCDSSTLTSFGPNQTDYVCDSWQNATLTDKDFWKGLNFTDSAVLMNTQLKPINSTEPTNIYLNSFYVGIGNTKTRNPTIGGGILVEPHATGARAVIGVPDLPPEKSITINQTMLIEVDMGCMELGLFTREDLDNMSGQFDSFATNWKDDYAGPEALREIVANYSGIVRNLVRPIFNESSKDDNGYLYPGKWTNVSSMAPLGYGVSPIAQITNWYLPINISGEPINFNGPNFETVQYNMTMECTADIYKALNVTLLNDEAGWITDYQCGMFGIIGSFADGGDIFAGMSRYFCAVTTQINLASATIVTDASGAISVNYTRLPSDLHHTVANWWDTEFNNITNITTYVEHAPYDRYTLSFNPDTGSTQHYVGQYSPYVGTRPQGPASAGNILSTLSSSFIIWDSAPFDNTGMAFLEDGTNYINFNASIIPSWSGKLTGALMRNSLVYNAYAAQQARGILITSTGGRPAICYDLRYGVAFIPLLICALIAVGWSIILVTTTTFKGAMMVQNLYGGLAPLRVLLCPKWDLRDTILAWQSFPEPHLRALRGDGGGIDGDVGVGVGHVLEVTDTSDKTSADETAVRYLRQGIDREGM